MIMIVIELGIFDDTIMMFIVNMIVFKSLKQKPKGFKKISAFELSEEPLEQRHCKLFFNLTVLNLLSIYKIHLVVKRH